MTTITHGPLAVRLGPEAWLTPAMAAYALEQFWQRVSLGAGFPVGVDQPVLVFEAASRAQVQLALRLKRDDVSWTAFESLAPPGAIPPRGGLLFPRVFHGKPASEGSSVDSEPSEDLVTWSAYLLTRWEESQVGVADDRGRARASDGLLWRLGVLDRPLLDEWAALARALIVQRCPGWAPARPRFELFLTSDLDAPRRFESAVAVARSSVAALVRRRSPATALRTAMTGLRALRDWRHDPNVKGFYRVLTAAERSGVRCAVYFMTADPGPRDGGYRVAQEPARTLLRATEDRGHEVGLHPGYATFRNRGLLAEQRQRLAAVAAAPPVGGRQHNLRFAAPDTWIDWEAVGMQYDSTVGYAEAPGFRAGTAHPFAAYDWRSDRALQLQELPLIVMDTTLRSYLKLGADAAERVTLDLAERVSQTGGVFTLLWHNSSFDGEYARWGDLFERLVGRLAAIQARAA